MTSNQLLKVIEGNQGEDGRGENYKDEGAGLSSMVKSGAGRYGEGRGQGARPRQ